MKQFHSRIALLWDATAMSLSKESKDLPQVSASPRESPLDHLRTCHGTECLQCNSPKFGCTLSPESTAVDVLLVVGTKPQNE